MNKINLSSLSSKEAGYLIGFFIGDGYCNFNKNNRHYKIEFYFNSISDNESAGYIRSLLEKIGLRPFSVKDKRFNSFRIAVNSKELMIFLSDKKINFESSKSNDGDYTLGLISGFIDAEGYVKNGEILLTQKNKAVLEKIKELAESIGIETRKFWTAKQHQRTTNISRLRLSTKFKYLLHSSYKVNKQYSGVAIASDTEVETCNVSN